MKQQVVLGWKLKEEFVGEILHIVYNGKVKTSPKFEGAILDYEVEECLFNVKSYLWNIAMEQEAKYVQLPKPVKYIIFQLGCGVPYKLYDRVPMERIISVNGLINQLPIHMRAKCLEQKNMIIKQYGLPTLSDDVVIV